MELGNCGITWFTHVPFYNGNRDLPPKDQMSLEVQKMGAVEVFRHLGDDDIQRLLSWVESEPIKARLEELGMLEEVLAWDQRALAAFRQFVMNTRNYRNFVFGGKPVTDPVEVFLRCTDASLLFEINTVINRAARLSGEALGNFVSQCGGSDSETSSEKTEASSANPAPETSGPPAANTQPEQTES